MNIMVIVINVLLIVRFVIPQMNVWNVMRSTKSNIKEVMYFVKLIVRI